MKISSREGIREEFAAHYSEALIEKISDYIEMHIQEEVNSLREEVNSLREEVTMLSKMVFI